MEAQTPGRDRSRDRPVRGVLRTEDYRRLAVFAAVLLVIVPTAAWIAGGSGAERAHWRPGLNLAPLYAAPFATLAHAALIVVLVVAGWIMLALPKGDRRHRTLGWIWVSAMLLMGATSLAVPHGESWIAAYFGGGSALALMGFGIYFVRKGRARLHARTMAMLVIALALMTVLALFPGRLLHEVFFAG